ncbi:MAG: hypothetical protein Q9169_005750 [Polycauliona sp. 2 TL-2023]
MRSAMISAAFVAGTVATHANGTEPSYTTKMVTAYTTFCPAATTLSHDGSVITVTEATTVVLPCPTGCPVTYPVVSVPVVPTTSAENPVVETHPAPVPETHPAPVETHPAPVETHPAPVETHPAPIETPVAPVETHPAPVAPETHPAPVPTGSSGPVSPPVSPPIYGNSTVPAGPTAPVGTAAPSGTGAPGGASDATPFEGAAPKMVASGASLVGLLGLAAFFL